LYPATLTIPKLRIVSNGFLAYFTARLLATPFQYTAALSSQNLTALALGDVGIGPVAVGRSEHATKAKVMAKRRGIGRCIESLL
jgi:hypothetical protein